MTENEPCDDREEIPAITTSCNSQTGEITVSLSFSDGRVVDTCVLSPDNPSQGRAA